MKNKKLLKFYFGADSLERAIDNLITKSALSPFGDALGEAEKICVLIGEKCELGKLWIYMDGVMSAMTEEEKKTLKEYSRLRSGFSKLKEEQRREIKRTAVKFFRRARNIERYGGAVGLVIKYYNIIV